MTRSFAARRRRWAAVLMTAVALVGCARNPVTGRNELSLVSEADEVNMGRQAAQQVAQSLGLVQDQALQDYVQRIGAGLAAASERPELPWTFRVVDDPTPNAFALPGGFIFVTRGMMTLMDNEAELASVLGHEIGHVTAKHSVQQISRTQLAQLGLGIGMILAPELGQRFGDLAGTGLQLLFLKYGRDAERQADDLGFNYALKRNYDVREMADVFTALGREGERAQQSPLPEWLSTHPNPGNRVEAVRGRVASLSRSLNETTIGEAEYLQRLEGLVYGPNPRNGFFQGNTFFHPDLRFRVTFPQGWQAQNTSAAVIGVSPQKDAAVQLSLAQGNDPTAAAQQFFGQQGIQPGQASRETINGLPAVASYFQAQTEQGVVEGWAAFLGYGGRTYQLIAYAPGGRFRSYDPVLRQVILSFGPTNDPAVLNAQPDRVSIVRIPQAMTLAQFNQRWPSSVPIEELAILNQADGPTSTLPAGTLAKRVSGGTVRAGN